MKRLIVPFAVAVLAVISSCDRQEEMAVEKQPIRFRASMEAVLADPETRVYVEENHKVYWNAGDHVTIFSEKTYNREYEYDGRTGYTGGGFTPVGNIPTWITEVPIETEYNYSIYPYHRYNACDYDGSLTVPFPASVTFKENDRGIGVSPVMVARDKGGDFMYKHVAGYIGLQLYGEGVSIASISLKSINNESLSGFPVVVFADDSDDAEPVLTFVNDPDDSPRMTITYPEPVALGATSDEAKIFWLSLPPTVMTKGFTLTVTDARGSVFSKPRNSSYVVERKKLKTIGPLEIVMEPVVTVTGVELDESDIELYVDETKALTATVLPADAPDKTVTWSSSDENVATVNSSGVVTAMSAGTAVITVTTNSEGKTASCNVTVKDRTSYQLALSPSTATVNYGESQVFVASLITTVGSSSTTSALDAASVTWSSSDAAVASVADGIAAGVGAGTATITAKYTPAESGAELSATAELTVKDVVSYSLAIDPESAEITVGSTQVFTLTLTTTTNGVPSEQPVTGATWSSSDAAVASVADGVATGVGAGTATITAKYTPAGSSEELSAAAEVTVTEIEDEVSYALSINPESAEVIVGSTQAFTLTLTITTNGVPSEQPVTGATWSSSDATVASVTDGVATGVSEGSVTLTATYTPEGSEEVLTVTAELKVNKVPNHAGDPIEIEEGENL